MKRLLLGLWSGKGIGWRILRMALALYAGLILVVVFLEDRFIFLPSKFPEGDWTPWAGGAEPSPPCEDVFMTARDGVRIHGWLCHAAAAEEPRMTLLWFHGNAGNVAYRYDMIRMLVRIPADILIVDYRGYGKSEGTPTEEGVYLDADAAWEELVRRRKVPPDRIVLFGKSLGGAVAVDLATRVKPAGLVVQSSFTSVPDMGRSLLPFLPGFVFRTRMDSLSKIPRVRSPVLVVHSPADEMIPFSMGRRLFDAAPDPKRFYEVEGAPHNETYAVGGEPYIEALRSFVRSCAPPSSAGD